jgi:hypothetical protein
MAVSENDVYLVWEDYYHHRNFKHISLARSIDNGAKFNEAVCLNQIELKEIPEDLPNNPLIAASKYVVYVVWFDNLNGISEPFLVKSTDNGTSFSTPVNLHKAADITTVFNMSVSRNNLYLVGGYRLGNDTVKYRIATSTDGGISFKRLASPAASDQLLACPSIVTSENDDYVYMIWSRKPPNHKCIYRTEEVYGPPIKNDKVLEGPYTFSKLKLLVTYELLIAKSKDGGSNFDKPIIMTSQALSPSARLTISQDHVYVAWKESKVVKKANRPLSLLPHEQILLSKSIDAGVAFSKPHKIITARAGLHFDIAAKRNKLSIVWSRNVRSRNNSMYPPSRMFIANITDAGSTTFSRRDELGEGALTSYVVRFDNRKYWYFAWNEGVRDTTYRTEIFFARVEM